MLMQVALLLNSWPSHCSFRSSAPFPQVLPVFPLALPNWLEPALPASTAVGTLLELQAAAAAANVTKIPTKQRFRNVTSVAPRKR
jgi:hypothetical protein